ncbi:unnamed protein product [Rhizoctonia solani]|uniref:Uncharacterized protein n=1 Tax=Rhizoctonia solani TaxID=456999 RepID=A0A8H3DG16_9AGAM|nr:unnamed protein product [Rhizoctonia solani]
MAPHTHILVMIPPMHGDLKAATEYLVRSWQQSGAPCWSSPEDMTSAAEQLVQLAETLTALGRLEEALDASQVATLLYQRSLGFPTNTPGHKIPRCDCDATQPTPGTLIRDKGPTDTYTHTHSMIPTGTYLNSILGINPIGYIMKVLKLSVNSVS